MALHEINDEAAAGRLAQHLQAQRDHPAVVITSHHARHDAWIPAQQVAEDLEGIADVWWMRNGEITWEFARHMPGETQVFGEAGRVYAIDNEWINRPRASRLHIAFSVNDGLAIADSLSAEALADAASRGLLAAQAAADVEVTGLVTGITAGRGLVKLSNHRLVSVNPGLVLEGLPVERLITAGQQVTGRLNPESGQLNLAPSVQPAAQALEQYDEGDVVLVKVLEVSSKQATVELFPGVRVVIEVGQITGNRFDAADDLMSIGEIVRARVTRTGPRWSLIMSDVDDDEVEVAAPPLLAGGPPLYVPDVLERAEAEPVIESRLDPEPDLEPAQSVQSKPPRPHPGMLDPKWRERQGDRRPVPPPSRPEPHTAAQPVPHVDDPGAVKHMTRTIAQLKADLEAARRENQLLSRHALEWQEKFRRAEDETKRLRTDRRTSAQRAKQDARRGTLGDRAAFATPEEQFRHEVYMAWVEKIPSHDKADLPLPEYTLSAWFLETLAERAPDVQKKVPEIVVEVLTGLADRSEGRQVHPLLDGSTTAAPKRRNNGLETCMRVAVKINSPSAPRLHYWKGGDVIEFSSVRLHDDMVP